MKIPAATFLLGFCFLATAAFGKTTVGSGKVVTEPRTVSGFHAVELAGSGDLTITQGDTESLSIEAEDNLLPLIETTVTDGTLRIGMKPNEYIKTTKKILLKLSVKTLDKLTVSGSGDVHAGALKADRFTLALPGSGDVAVEKLETGALTVALAGSGDILLSAGRADSQTVSINGSGDYDASTVQSAKAAVSINGSGDCQVWAGEKLDVTINGSGSVEYYGTPEVKKKVNGSGSVNGLGAKAAQ